MAMLEGDAEKIFIDGADKNVVGSDWERLLSGLADLAADVACVMGDVVSVQGDLRKVKQEIDDIKGQS